MFRRLRTAVLVSFVTVLPYLPLAAQTEEQDSGWRIGPEKINIQVGEDRPLQLLDDSAQELHDATWSIDNPDLATIEEEEGRAVVHPSAVGTVVVTATWRGETRTREVKIWSPLRPLPAGTNRWSTHDFGGRNIGDLPAVPTGDGPNMYSMEEFPSGSVYLRAIREDGIHAWTLLLPERVHNVELICGDWLGGALIGANRDDSYTLYAIGKDGEVRWQRTMKGVRKGLADSTDHLVHVLNQSPDGNTVTVLGLDEKTGAQWFELPVPISNEKQVNLRREGQKMSCAVGSVSNLQRALTSGLMVNMDGYAYLAFMQRDWTLTAAKCTPGQAIDPKDVTFSRDDKLVLWKIDPDGSFSPITVEATKTKQPLSMPAALISPTEALTTDNMNGTLISVRVSHNVVSGNANELADEFIYRVNQNGELVFKFPLPKYSGSLKDVMVIGEDNVAFATRGSFLIAFSLVSGKELWRWESNEPEISVFAALANGACLVQTPTVLVEVASSTKAKQVFTGKAMMDWLGNMYRKKD
jgi:outer membrane protein assembly factor BamB